MALLLSHVQYVQRKQNRSRFKYVKWLAGDWRVVKSSAAWARDFGMSNKHTIQGWVDDLEKLRLLIRVPVEGWNKTLAIWATNPPVKEE
jgi:hypothetical protein